MCASLVDQLCSAAVMDQAYGWLIKQRKHHPPNSDVWDLRWRWAEETPRLRRLLLEEKYRLSPQRRHFLRAAQETVDLWSARDALVLKGVSLVLTQRLDDAFPRRCFHFPAGRGVKAALREVARALPAHRFVFRTDVRGYYDSIQPVRVMNQERA